MDMNAVYPSKYLKAADLQGRQVTVVIDRVEMEQVGDDNKPVVYFQHKQKGVCLNKTNTGNIAAAYGWESEDWIGKEVVIYTAWVDFNGRSTEAIRVRAPSAAERKNRNGGGKQQVAQQSPQRPLPQQARPPASDDDYGAREDEQVPF